jgi:hypothetical protein
MIGTSLGDSRGVASRLIELGASLDHLREDPDELTKCSYHSLLATEMKSRFQFRQLILWGGYGFCRGIRAVLADDHCNLDRIQLRDGDVVE